MEKAEIQQKVREFLKERPVGVLSTVGDDSKPYSTTIYFLADEDLNIYFLSKSETKKIENIRNNNHVMLVAFDAKTQTNVQISGSADEVKNDSHSHNIFKDILEITRKTSGAEVPPISKLFAGAYVVYKIEPTHINYTVYNQKDMEMAVFETMDF